MDGIGNLENLPRLIFINEEYGNLKVAADGAGVVEILTKRRIHLACSIFHRVGIYRLCGRLLCEKCCRRDGFFKKHIEYC